MREFDDKYWARRVDQTNKGVLTGAKGGTLCQLPSQGYGTGPMKTSRWQTRDEQIEPKPRRGCGVVCWVSMDVRGAECHNHNLSNTRRVIVRYLF